MSGELSWMLFRDYLRTCLKEIKMELERKIRFKSSISLETIVVAKRTQKILSPFSTGNWALNKNSPAKNGVSSSITPFMGLECLFSHENRINTPVGKEGKQSGPRALGAHKTRKFVQVLQMMV